MRSWPALVATAGSGRPSPPGSDTTDSPAFQDLLQAALTDFAVSAIDEPSADSLRAFFHDSAERDRALIALRSAFPGDDFASVDVPDEDWAARSQANLTAIRVGAVIVAPPWDPVTATAPTRDHDQFSRQAPAVGADLARPILIVIQPSMGFGTGHHATTRLCLGALQRAHVGGRSVIDVGTGSGVLAIAASRLGATPVIGIDDDPDAVQSARENLDLNQGAQVDLRIGDLRTSVLGVADVVLANLTGTLLVQAAAHLRTLLSPRGRLILSGLMDHEEAEVIAAFPDLAVFDRTQEDEWVCLVLTNETNFR